MVEIHWGRTPRGIAHISTMEQREGICELLLVFMQVVAISVETAPAAYVGGSNSAECSQYINLTKGTTTSFGSC